MCLPGEQTLTTADPELMVSSCIDPKSPKFTLKLKTGQKPYIIRLLGPNPERRVLWRVKQKLHLIPRKPIEGSPTAQARASFLSP